MAGKEQVEDFEEEEEEEEDDAVEELAVPREKRSLNDSSDDDSGNEQEQPRQSEEPEDDDDDEDEEEENNTNNQNNALIVEKGTDRKLFRDDRAKNEEKEGLISFMVVQNNDSTANYRLLTGAKNIFQKQLPKMPKEYISRLVYDRRHKSLCIVRRDGVVLGAICYRLFGERNFLEIVFCAITSTEQVKGYGSYLMNRMKEQAKKEGDIRHFLTYADNYAIGYFKKQGFSVSISLDRSVWGGYIKDYEGGTLMQCTLLPKVDYMNVYQILHIQKQALLERIKEKSNSHIIHPGLDFSHGKKYRPEEIPGAIEAGWTAELSQAHSAPKKNKLYEYLKSLLVHLENDPSAWPFMEPVNPLDVPDYFNVVKNPMDLYSISQKIESAAYSSVQDFINDVQLLIDNCKSYNSESTPYHKCAIRLEASFKERLNSRKFTAD